MRAGGVDKMGPIEAVVACKDCQWSHNIEPLPPTLDFGKNGDATGEGPES